MSNQTNAMLTNMAINYAAPYVAEQYSINLSSSASAMGLSSSSSQSVSGASSNAGAVMAAAGAAQDVAGIWSSNGDTTQKLQATRDRAALAVADYYTAGFASQAYAFAWKKWPGTMQKIQKFRNKLDVGTRYIGKLFKSDKWKTEGKRLQKLLDKGVQIPEELQGSLKLTKGRSREELVNPNVARDFVGTAPDGTWVNNKFALSRKESDLKAEDIWGFSGFFEKFGNDWLGKFSQDQRKQIADKALELGVVKEHHGTIDIKWSPELEQFANKVQESK